MVTRQPRDVFKCCYSTDLRAHQRLRLLVEDAEDLLQAQPEVGWGGKVGGGGCQQILWLNVFPANRQRFTLKASHNSAGRLTCWRRRHRPDEGAGRDGTESRRLQPREGRKRAYSTTELILKDCLKLFCFLYFYNRLFHTSILERAHRKH